jgi:hypothetical protein
MTEARKFVPMLLPDAFTSKKRGFGLQAFQQMVSVGLSVLGDSAPSATAGAARGCFMGGRPFGQAGSSSLAKFAAMRPARLRRWPRAAACEDFRRKLAEEEAEPHIELPPHITRDVLCVK